MSCENEIYDGLSDELNCDTDNNGDRQCDCENVSEVDDSYLQSSCRSNTNEPYFKDDVDIDSILESLNCECALVASNTSDECLDDDISSCHQDTNDSDITYTDDSNDTSTCNCENINVIRDKNLDEVCDRNTDKDWNQIIDADCGSRSRKKRHCGKLNHDDDLRSAKTILANLKERKGSLDIELKKCLKRQRVINGEMEKLQKKLDKLIAQRNKEELQQSLDSPTSKGDFDNLLKQCRKKQSKYVRSKTVPERKSVCCKCTHKTSSRTNICQKRKRSCDSGRDTCHDNTELSKGYNYNGCNGDDANNSRNLYTCKYSNKNDNMRLSNRSKHKMKNTNLCGNFNTNSLTNDGNFERASCCDAKQF